MSSNLIQSDLNPGSNYSNPSNFATVNGTNYFTAYNDTTDSYELWKTNPGTEKPSVVASGLLGGEAAYNQSSLTNINNSLYFIANSSTTGNTELWKIDISQNTSVKVAGFDSGVVPTSNIANVNGTPYLTTYNYNNSESAIWKVNENTNNPLKVTEFPSSVEILSSQNPTAINGTLYFTTFDDNIGQSQLRKIDPITNNSEIVTVFEGNKQIAYNPNLTNLDGTLYFVANDNVTNNYELWKINPTTNSASEVTKLPQQAYALNDLTSVNGKFYFTTPLQDDSGDRQLWKFDPTTSEPVSVKQTQGAVLSGDISSLTNANGTLYFTASDGNSANNFYGQELWKIDSKNDIPVLVSDINPGADSSSPLILGYDNGQLYLAADNGQDGQEFWQLDVNTGSVAKTLNGTSGDDLHIVENVGDVIAENANGGTDSVYANVSNYTLGDNIEHLYLQDGVNIGSGNNADNAVFGNQLNNILNGQDGNDYLNGGAGKDKMIGGQGNDIYDVDTLQDIVVEKPNEGIDLVYASVSGYTLGDNVERLQLYGNAKTGAGNGLDNALYGNLQDDTLYGYDGNDYINGGVGNDTMIGGKGNDIYDVDNLNDVIVENPGEGVDEVYASVSGYTLADNVEWLRLYGNATSGNGNSGDNALFGNILNDTLDGKDGNDYINGGVGNDTMIGGKGDDIYDVDSLNDVIVENASEGNDLVYASVSGYTLGANLEQLHLHGDAMSGTGNDLDNIISGNRLNDNLSGGLGNDILVGYGGDDILNGGGGNDTFVFSNDPGANPALRGIDTIVDFTVGEDKIQLGKSIFSGLTTGSGVLSSSEFSIVTQDEDVASKGAIVYNSSNGKLFYNANGLDGNGGQFAQLSTGLALTNNDFSVIG